MDFNIELKLIGITYNQIESGVYALILEDLIQGRRLAIVIGYPEAQSIECRLQNVRTPRPLTHDLMATMIKDLDAQLLRVDIHKLVTGPYAGRLTLMDSTGEIKIIDARSSDAIALAIRTGAPIYTTRELMDKEGYSPQQNQKGKQPAKDTQAVRESTRSEEELIELLNKYVSEENYEAAAEIKRELDNRRKNDENPGLESQQ